MKPFPDCVLGLIFKRVANLPWPASSVGERASSQYAKAVGSIPGQGTYKKQPMNA